MQYHGLSDERLKSNTLSALLTSGIGIHCRYKFHHDHRSISILSLLVEYNVPYNCGYPGNIFVRLVPRPRIDLATENLQEIYDKQKRHQTSDRK